MGPTPGERYLCMALRIFHQFDLAGFYITVTFVTYIMLRKYTTLANVPSVLCMIRVQMECMSNSEFFYFYENKKEFHFSLSLMRESLGSHPLHNLLLESDKYLQWIIRFHVKNWWYLLCFNKSRFENISFIKQKNNIVLKIAIFIFAFPVETLYTKADF